MRLSKVLNLIFIYVPVMNSHHRHKDEGQKELLKNKVGFA